MKIVTVNIPSSYCDAIKKLVGEGGLYPSRSELIRVACREFLIRELRIATNMEKSNESELNHFEENYDTENSVKVPVERNDEKNEPVREFKTYKIIKRLEFNDEGSTHGESKSNYKPKRKPKGKRLGNIYFGTAYDQFGNLITTKKDAEILNK